MTEKVLLVLMGSLGDVVRGGALASALARGLPECEISWLVEPAWASLVRSHRAVKETIIFERNRGLAGVLGLRRTLRARTYDIVLDLQRHFKSGLFSSWVRAGRSIGVHRRDAKEFNWLFHRERTAYVGDERSKLEMYGEFLSLLGLRAELVEADGSVDFGFRPPTEFPTAMEGIRPASYLAVVLGSSWESKDWFAEGYIDLITRLTDGEGHTLVLVGTEKDALLGSRLAEGRDKVVNIAGETSLVQLAAVLAHARLAVGPDSGPGHLCAAYGVPYVSLFGPTSPRRTAPYGAERWALQSPIGCAPCSRRHCPGLDRMCMRLISPPAVVRMIGQALHNAAER